MSVNLVALGYHSAEICVNAPCVILTPTMKTSVFVGLFFAVVLLSINVWSQTRRHDAIMKDVNATYEKLKKSLDAQKDKDAFEDASKLQKLFKEVEDFWTPFETKDAIEAARGAQNSFAALSRSVQVNNFQQAVATYNSAAQFCRDCHSVHRIQAADKSYLIKP